jgi:hypothetical protein
MAIAKVTYSIDTSSLIHAWRRSYPPSHFPLFWEKLDQLVKEQRLDSSLEVLRELKKNDHDVHAWCAKRPHLFLPIDGELQDHVRDIMRKHPRLVDTSTGRSAADPFVIGVARTRNPLLTVVSEENNGKVSSPRIPDVCRSEGIKCIRLVGLIQEENWVFR